MLYIGIDVAKRSHVAAAVDGDEGVVVEPFGFGNTQRGFERLLERLAKKGVSPEGSLVGMEATGHYWVALFDFLAANGFEVAVINPIQTDAWRRVDTVRPAKTDGIDAVLIADLNLNLNLPRFRLHPYAAIDRRPSRCLASNSAGLRFPSAEWILTLL